MKKISLSVVFLVSFIITALAANNIPERAGIFVEAHFENSSINSTQDKNVEGVIHYIVKLSDKTIITFDQTGAWSKIDYKKTPKKITYLPENIQKELIDNKQIKRVKEVKTDGFEIIIQLKNNKQVNTNIFGIIQK